MPTASSNHANYIYRYGTAPNTRAAISQKNKIYSYTTDTTNGATAFAQMGVVSEFGHDESRSVEPIRGVGFGDQIAELVPGVTEPMTLTLNKTLLYAVNLFQAVGYKGGIEGLVRSLKHHRWPFDIRQELVLSEIASDATDLGGATGTKTPISALPATFTPTATPVALFTFFEGCWFNSYSASYTSDAAIVAENSSVTVTDIIDGTSPYGEFIDSGLAGVSLRFTGTGAAPTGDFT